MQPSPAAITLRAPAAGLAGDGGPAGGGGRAAGRGGAGARVRGGDAAGGGGRDVPGPAGHAGERGGVRLPGQRRRAAARSRRSAWSASGECGTRAVLGAATSPLATGEQPLARQLLGKLAPGDLLLADRNFLSHGLLAEVLAAGVHVLWRAKSDVDLPVLEVLPDGTWLSRIADPAASRRMRRKGARPAGHPRHHRPRHRVLGDHRGRQRDLRDLHPGHRHPRSRAADPASRPPRAYASRWQLETCFDELETSIRGGAAVVLRSKSPPMIRQEIYAMLCCYQAIRTLISHAAGDAGIDPARISFTRARDAIRSRISDSGCFSP